MFLLAFVSWMNPTSIVLMARSLLVFGKIKSVALRAKLPIVVLLWCAFAYLAFGNGETPRFSFDARGMQLSDALQMMKQQSSLPLEFDCTWAQLVKIDTTVDNLGLDDTLKAVLGGLGYAITYYEDERGELTALQVTIAVPEGVSVHDVVVDYIDKTECLPNMRELSELMRENEVRYNAQNYFMIGTTMVSKAEAANIKSRNESDRSIRFGSIRVSERQLNAVKDAPDLARRSDVVAFGDVIVDKSAIEQIVFENRLNYETNSEWAPVDGVNGEVVYVPRIE